MHQPSFVIMSYLSSFIIQSSCTGTIHQPPFTIMSHHSSFIMRRRRRRLRRRHHHHHHHHHHHLLLLLLHHTTKNSKSCSLEKNAEPRAAPSHPLPLVRSFPLISWEIHTAESIGSKLGPFLMGNSNRLKEVGFCQQCLPMPIACMLG